MYRATGRARRPHRCGRTGARPRPARVRQPGPRRRHRRAGPAAAGTARGRLAGADRSSSRSASSARSTTWSRSRSCSRGSRRDPAGPARRAEETSGSAATGSEGRGRRTCCSGPALPPQTKPGCHAVKTAATPPRRLLPAASSDDGLDPRLGLESPRRGRKGIDEGEPETDSTAQPRPGELGARHRPHRTRWRPTAARSLTGSMRRPARCVRLETVLGCGPALR